MSYKLPHVSAAFPVFCQKILPLTFDNSESYLEFVAHINAKLNEVIHALNAQNLAFNDFVNLVNQSFEAFKTDIDNKFTEYKAEVQQALDDLERAFNEDIDEIQGEIDGITDRVEDVENDVETLIKESGDLSVFPEKVTTVDYTMEIESANCNIYYKNPNSDIWHEYSTDTTINDFIVNETSESVGNKDFLFLFCPPEGYPEEQFVFSAGAIVTATGATSDDSAAAIYSRETIPAEDFNTGLILCANGEVTTAGQVDTVVITNTDEVQNYSCLYLSNNFVLGLIEPLIYSFSVSVSEVFGTLYSEKTGQNVIPRIRTNATLVYDSNGVLGAVSALPTTLPDNLLYFGTADSGTADAYSLIFDTECVIYENYSDGVTQNSWKKYSETTLREFLPNYTGWLNPSTGTSKNLYVFFKEMTLPNGFKFLSGANGIETGYTGTNYYSGTWIDFGHSDTLPTLADIPSFVRLYKDSLSLVGDSTHRSRTAANWDLTIPHDRAKYAYIYGNAFFFGSLKTTLLNGGGRSDTWYITTPSITYPIVDEDSNPVKVTLNIDDTLQYPQGVLGVSDSIAETVHNIPAALATKQNIIDSNNKLSSDLVDDSAATNKFATAAQLAQIATNTSDIAGKQNTIDSSHMLSSDLVDDTNNVHKFATAAELEQIELNKTNISSNAADDYLAWTKGKNKLNFDINTARALNTSSVYTWSSNTCTVNGITFTFNADNTITATGTIADSQSNTILSLVSYIGVSGDVLSAQQSGNAYIYLRGGSTATASAPYSTWASGDVGVARTVAIAIASTETSAVNKTFYPMVCTAADWQKSQEYYPYAMGNVELTAAIQAIQAQLAN